MKHFFIITNSFKDKNLMLTRSMQDYIETKGGRCGYYVSRGEENDSDCIRPEALPEDLDLIFVIGGDGTLIRAARDTAQKHVPLIGVNLGTLGYLCELEETTVFSAIDQIMDDNFVLEARMRLSGHPVRAGEQLLPQTALNDIVIHRSGALQLVSLVVYVNGQYLYRFDGDGVIISTPTGSTGYNLSAGGPIVDPKARMILITPINSHTLNAKSIVIGAEDEVTVEIGSRRREGDEQVVVSIDGDYNTCLDVGDQIVIHQAKKDCRILKLGKLSFLEILRKKMQSYH
ncbi:NAD(+)/NADH kinase [Lachnospiraceae bacterium 47-T17]